MSQYDTLIRGGTIIDGTMVPRYRADMAIQDGRIAKIGGLKGATADQVIDAGDNIVAPGYIDIHTHYDAQLLWDPYCTISGYHGVTSVVIGNCGFGFAPIPKHLRDRAMLMMTRNEAIPFETMKEGMGWDEGDWVTFPDWLNHLDKVPKGVNVMSLVPLCPIYAWVMGGVDEAKERRPTDAEMDQMIALMYEAMDHGAVGFSYQRAGVPSIQPDWDGSPMITDLLPDEEIFKFGRALKERGEGFIEMFDAAPSSHDTVEEFMSQLAEESGRPIVRNIILADDDNPKAHEAFLDWLYESHDKGLQCYGMGYTVRAPTFLTFQDWSLWDGCRTWHKVMNGKYEDRVEMMKQEENREGLRKEIDRGIMPGPGAAGHPQLLKVHSSGGYPELEKYVGRCITDIAKEENKHIADVLVDLSLASEFNCEFMGDAYGASAATTKKVLDCPYVVPGISDGGAHTHFIVQGAYPTDLLEWMVREEGLVSAEKAHYGLSRLPAHLCGFQDRGVLREGGPADVVVYNPETIRRTPNWDQAEKVTDFPADGWRQVQRAEGLNYTLVNGQVTFEGLKCTGATPGKLLRDGRG